MAKQANRMMIGGFVVIAVIILAASLVVFGSGKFFKKTNEYVLYFDGSVKGLSVGAPVLFQGVQVGAVTSISIQADMDTSKVDIPVIVEIEPERFVTESGQHAESDEELREQITRLIEAGMRAVLEMQSFITGQLMIEVDFHPDTPVNLRNIDKDHLEIPTIPSTTQRLAQTLQRLDLEGMQKKPTGHPDRGRPAGQQPGPESRHPGLVRDSRGDARGREKGRRQNRPAGR
jgi:paraquat-inducible protein B